MNQPGKAKGRGFSWFIKGLFQCIRDKRMPYGYYKLKDRWGDLVKKTIRTGKRSVKREIRIGKKLIFSFWFLEYAYSYLRFWIDRLKGRLPQPVNDVVFVIKKKNSGWILEGICREIARHYPGKYQFHYVQDSPILPPARAYFFSHYTFFPKCFKKTPHLWGAKTFVWFPHLREKLDHDSRELFYALNFATKTVSPCSMNLHLLRQKGIKPKKLTYILGGADPDFFLPHHRGSGAVGFCTAYYERKSPDLMLEIIRSLPQRQFILLGPRSESPLDKHRNWKNWKRFNELVAQPNLTYVEAAYPEYPKFYAQMDVLVSASRVEGGPIALIEAMMCNIVPVATRTGFAADIIRHGENGFLFDVDKPSSVACDLIEKAYELKTNVRETAMHLTWENFSRNVQALFEKS